MNESLPQPQSAIAEVFSAGTHFDGYKVAETSNHHLINGLLSPGQIAQIKAHACGTFIGCEMAAGIAQGRKVLSRFDCPKPSGVLIFQGGMSHEDFSGRLSGLTTKTGSLPIRVISPSQFTRDAMKDLCDETFQDELLALLANQKDFKVIMLDGIDCFLPEKPEPRQINRLLNGLRGISVGLISIESNGRGGLPLFPNQPDLILHAKAMDGSDERIIRIAFEKARSLRHDQQRTFFVTLAEQEDGKFAFVEARMDEYLKARTLHLLLRGLAQQKIAKDIGKDQSTISRWITKELVENSLVVRDGRKYIATEAGRKLLAENGLGDF